MATEIDLRDWFNTYWSWRDWRNMCQALTWNACDHFGYAPRSYLTARLAYEASDIVSYDPAAAPFGAFHYWRQPHPEGHVALALGDGRCLMASSDVDVHWAPYVGTVAVDGYTRRKGSDYLGWSYTNGMCTFPIGENEMNADERAALESIKSGVDALVAGVVPTAKGYPFPARDAVQNNLEFIVTRLNEISDRIKKLESS